MITVELLFGKNFSKIHIFVSPQDRKLLGLNSIRVTNLRVDKRYNYAPISPSLQTSIYCH